VAVDYFDERAFAEAVDHVVTGAGVPDLVLGWFHEDAPALALARQLSALAPEPSIRPIDFFHVLASATSDPAANRRTIEADFGALANLRYHSIVLGFVSSQGASRWLTNEEISSGVIEALESGLPRRTVGTTTPWAERPQ
jgi:hypothetical protein